MRNDHQRRRGIINAAARRYGILIDPELFEALLELPHDPVEAVGEAVDHMAPDEVVLNIDHFERR